MGKWFLNIVAGVAAFFCVLGLSIIALVALCAGSVVMACRKGYAAGVGRPVSTPAASPRPLIRRRRL